ncbi:MAG: OmpW family outer membrane protein [Candidatus Helarchaeota archaeon]
MKRKYRDFSIFSFIFFHLIIFITAINLLPQESKELKVRVIIKDAPLRLKPNSDSLIIKRLPLGAELDFVKEMGQWIKIKLPPDKDGIVIEGYIHQSMVERLYEKLLEPPKIKEEKPIITPVLTSKPITGKKVEKRLKFGVGIIFGYAMPSYNNYNSGLKYGGNFLFGITKNIAVELSSFSFRSEVKENPEELSKGVLSVIPINLSILVRFPINNRFVPYIAGGGAYFFNTFTIDKNIIDSWNSLGFEIKESIKKCIGFHLGAGIDFFMQRNIALNLDIGYLINRTKGNWSIIDQISNTKVSRDIDSLDINSLVIGLSLRFFL